MPFYPGPGLGGHCIPIDPFYLTWKAREYEMNTRFIELAGEVNTNMPYWVVQKVMDALNDHGKRRKGSKIWRLGAAYKKDIDDDRESPGYAIMKMLLEKGAVVSYNDPWIPALKPTRKYNFQMTSTPITPDVLTTLDAVIIVTDHSDYDIDEIVEYSKMVIDTRNATKAVKDKREKIVMA